MEVGDQVKIKDGSYMLSECGGKLVHFKPNLDHIGKCNDIFTVLAMGCRLPADGEFHFTNNTIIVNNMTQEIWFCRADVNLKVVVECVELTVSEISRRLGYEVKIVK